MGHSLPCRSICSSSYRARPWRRRWHSERGAAVSTASWSCQRVETRMLCRVRDKVNSSENRVIVLWWVLLPLALVSSRRLLACPVQVHRDLPSPTHNDNHRPSGSTAACVAEQKPVRNGDCTRGASSTLEVPPAATPPGIHSAHRACGVTTELACRISDAAVRSLAFRALPSPHF